MLDDDKKTRKTDPPFNDPLQSSRFVQMQGSWFFLTRESGVKGPFDSREDADRALQLYLVESTDEIPVTASNFDSKLPPTQLRS